MGRKAVTLDEQVSLLRSRNMTISDELKAKEILFDVGYFRMGFYWFPLNRHIRTNIIVTIYLRRVLILMMQ